MSRLTTFVPPRPNRLAIALLTPVVRVVCLHGLLGIDGLMRIESIDFPAADQERFRAAVNPGTAALITPNHPEFLTDWLLDKELSARHAPLMASWATHDVVNGMGAAMQRFWLANNLIAQIPGAGGAAGKAHSIAWALKGHAVLLHPEGSVAWTGDTVQPLFPGVADMAIEAANEARERGRGQRVFVVPVIWRFRFTRDVHTALGRELDLVERKLGHTGLRDTTPAERVHALYSAMLARDEVRWSLPSSSSLPFAARQGSLLAALNRRLEEILASVSAEPSSQAASDESFERARQLTRLADRWMRSDAAQAHQARDDMRALVKTLRRAIRFTPAWYPGERLTQEQVAENIKRLRADYCFTGWRDDLHRFVPRPVGPRVAHVRVADPIDVTLVASASTEATLADLRSRMQRALDELGRSRGHPETVPTYPNPFR